MKNKIIQGTGYQILNHSQISLQSLFSRYQVDQYLFENIQSENQRYINEPVGVVETDALISGGTLEKILRNIYIKYLSKIACISATCSASERAFSAAKYIITYSKYQIDVDNANYMLCLKSSLKDDSINFKELFD